MQNENLFDFIRRASRRSNCRSLDVRYSVPLVGYHSNRFVCCVCLWAFGQGVRGFHGGPRAWFLFVVSDGDSSSCRLSYSSFHLYHLQNGFRPN